MYTFSDAWFLTSLILNKDWLTLQQVLATGDAINHAIFTKEEINLALSIFINLNYIEMDKNKNIRATSKALYLCPSSLMHSSLFQITETILNELNELADNKVIDIIEYFSDEEIDQAYKKYRMNIKNTLKSILKTNE